VLIRAKEDVVMLVELSMVEQRYDAVKVVLDGAMVKDVAIRYRVDRRTLHRWLVCYANEGLAALADKSMKPDGCPHQIAPDIEARIVELRRSQPGWGPRRSSTSSGESSRRPFPLRDLSVLGRS
jgi:transposase